MVTWVVIFSSNLRQTSPFLRKLPVLLALFSSFIRGATSVSQLFYNHAIPHSFAFFCTFLRRAKNQLLCFHAIPHSLTKKRALAVVPDPLPSPAASFLLPPPYTS
jgi:hypothetical protein